MKDSAPDLRKYTKLIKPRNRYDKDIVQKAIDSTKVVEIIENI